MKFLKRVSLLLFIIVAVTLLFRGWLYRHLITYKHIGLRTNYSVTNKNLAHFIDENDQLHSSKSIFNIINLALAITSKKLNFTSDKNYSDPNKLFSSEKAHCVGYATFFASTCNYLLEKYKLSNVWIAKPMIGQLYCFGTNIHGYFDSSFFNDHDFVIIENKTTGEIIAVDPTVYDYLRINYVTFSK